MDLCWNICSRLYINLMCGPLSACYVVGKMKMILEDKFQGLFLHIDIFLLCLLP